MGELTVFDMAILLLVGITAVRGVMRGFVTEVLSLFAWVAAVLVLRMFYDPAAEMIGEKTGSETGAAIIAFLLLFILAFGSFRLIARELGKRTRESVIGPVDRILGLGFGALKGLLVASLLFLLVNLFFDVVWGRNEAKPAWLESSKTYPLLKLSSQAVSDYIEKERRRGEEKDAAKDKAPPPPPPAGYDKGARDALDGLIGDGK